MVKFFRKFENIQDFFDFFEVFHRKTFLYSELQSRAYHHKIPRKNPHRTVHVRSRGSTGENSFIPKTVRKCDFTWVKIAQVHSKPNKPTLKAYQNHRTVLNINYVYFHEKNAHAFQRYLRKYKFLSKSLESNSQGIRSKFLYHQNQHRLLNQKPYLDYKKSLQEKNLLLGIQPKYNKGKG